MYDERRRVEVQTQVVSQLLQQLNDAVGAVVRKAKRDGGDADDSSSIGTLLCDADDEVDVLCVCIERILLHGLLQGGAGASLETSSVEGGAVGWVCSSGRRKGKQAGRQAEEQHPNAQPNPTQHYEL